MKKHYRKEQDCLNCGANLEGHFCHVCGQENLQLKESFWHLMVESVGDYFHFDSKFFHTLRPLLFIPGKLTNDYNAGKRVQYLHPIRMYIFISLVFFIVLFKYTKNGQKETHEETKQENPSINMETEAGIDSVKSALTTIPWVSDKQRDAVYSRLDKRKSELRTDSQKNTRKKSNWNFKTVDEYVNYQKSLPKEKRDGIFESYLTKKGIVWKGKGDNKSEVLIENIKHNVPKMMFFLLPVYALILKVVFRRSKKFYVEHLIHSMHIHCFFFLFYLVYMLLGFWIPESVKDVLQMIAFVLLLLYIYKSFRAVYHRSRLRTITKMTGVGFSYSVVVFIVFACLAVISFIST